MKAIKLSVLSLALVSAGASAKDARSIAMGDTGITTGKGVSGAMLNPAILMKHKKQGLKGSFRLGLNVGATDREGIYDDVKDGKDTIDNLDAEIKQLESKTTLNASCADPSAADSTVCATGVSDLRNAVSSTKQLLNNVSGKPVDVLTGLNLGFSYTGSRLPFAVNVASSAKANISTTVSQKDLGYLDSFTTANGGNDNLTKKDIDDNNNINIVNGKLSISDTDEFDLTSTAQGTAVIRNEVAVALAAPIPVNFQYPDTLYAGLTPKIVHVTAGNVNQSVKNVDDFDLKDNIEGSKVEENRFTFDLGGLYTSATTPELSYAVVIKNAFPYSIKTKDGLEIDTETQVKVGLGYETKAFNIALEGALNEAKDLGVDTQPIGLGIEGNWKWFGLRAGVAHDLSLEKDPTTYSLGTDLGFIELGAKYNGEKSAEVSLQVASDF